MLMDPIVTASLISAGSNILGGLFGGGGSQGLSREDLRYIADFQGHQALRNEDFQHELAEHGLSVRIKDADEAGISHLAAIGAAPMGGSPTAIVPFGPPEQKAPSPWGKALSSMGQDISRAALATQTDQQRQLMAAQIRKTNAEADFAQSQAANSAMRTSTPTNPPLPIPNMYIPVRDKDGSVKMIMNPDIAMGMHADIPDRWDQVSDIVYDRIVNQGRPLWSLMGTASKRALAPWTWRRGQ